MKERQKMQRKDVSTDDARREARRLQRVIEESEQRVTELERKVTALTAELEDPELYTKPAGMQRAAKAGKELDAAKRE
ncbi:MAG: hypothetical protein ABR591_16440, partial [Candidatus Velthaea sp.]